MTEQFDRTDIDGAEPAEPDDRRRKKKVAVAILLVLLLAIILGLAFSPSLMQLLRNSLRRGGYSSGTTYLYSIGQDPKMQPTGVAVAGDGRVYIADVASHQIRVFDPNGRELLAFGRLKDGKQTHLSEPVHLAVSGDEVYVTDRGLRGVYVFTLDGVFERSFIAPDPRWSPLGVSVGSDGYIYVTDVGVPQAHKVRVFNPSGMEVLEFGKTAEIKGINDRPGCLYFPDRALPYGDSIFVSDSNNSRVQVFDKSGRFRYIIPTTGVPRGLVFDPVGHLMVVDTLGCTVDVYSQSGTKLGSLGEDGGLQFPDDIALDKDGRIYIADRASGRVQVWGLPSQARQGRQGGSPIRWEWLLLAIPLVVAVPLVFVSRRVRESWEREDDE